MSDADASPPTETPADGRRVRVGTTFIDPIFLIYLAVAAAAATITVLISLFGKDPFWEVLFLVATGVALVVACARGIVLAVGRKWVEPMGVGFRLTTWRGTFDLTPADVTGVDTAVSLANETDDETAPPDEYVRTVRLRVNHPGLREPVRFAYRWRLSADDPLGDLLGRLLNRVAGQTERELRDGAVLSGNGWALTNDTLAVRTPDGEVEHGRDEVTAELVAPGQTEHALGQLFLVDGRVLVWAAGADDHLLSLPLLSPNAGLLHRLLAARAPARPPSPVPAAEWEYAADERPTDAHGLGPVLFSRGRPLRVQQAGRARVGAVVTLVVVLLALGVGLAVARWLWASLSVVVIGLVALASVKWVWLLLPLTRRWPGLLRCHTHGVAKQTADGVVRVRFDEVCVFTFAATVTVAGRWSSPTEVKLRFEAADGRVIKHKVEFVGEDRDLDWLREHLGRTMAVGMKRRLDAGEVVPWTDRISFEPDGVSVAVTDDPGDDLLIEWDDFRLVGTTPGRFGLFARRTAEPVHEVGTSAANFYPGFYLIQARQPSTDRP